MRVADAWTLDHVAIGSVFVGLAVLGLKFVAYYLTGSIALFSDALESIVNVGTAIAALIALRFSARPADANHPYGHYKAEYFSVVLEGVLIVIASLVILREAYHGITAPRLLDAPVEGLLVNGAAAVINAAVVLPAHPHGAAAPVARPRRRRQASPHRRAHLGGRHRRPRPCRGHRLGDPRPAARGGSGARTSSGRAGR